MRTRIKTRTWVLLFALAAGVLALLCWFWMGRGGKSQVAEVVQDGVVLREIDLGRVVEPESFMVESPAGGFNRVEVEPGRIRVAAADCPDQVCVHQGWLGEDTSLPLICLPHRLVIRLKEPGALDAAAR